MTSSRGSIKVDIVDLAEVDATFRERILRTSSILRGPAAVSRPSDSG
jgi:hypothetical protein